MIEYSKINCGSQPKGVMRKACHVSDAWREKMFGGPYQSEEPGISFTSTVAVE